MEETNLSKNVCASATHARLLQAPHEYSKIRKEEVAETGSFLNPVISRCAEMGGMLLDTLTTSRLRKRRKGYSAREDPIGLVDGDETLVFCSLDPRPRRSHHHLLTGHSASCTTLLGSA